MSALQSMPVGIVVERRDIDNRWEDYSWSPIAVIPGAPPPIEMGEGENGEGNEGWRLLREGDGWRHYLVGTLNIELFRRETEGYKVNLSNSPPHVYVVLSPGEEAGDADVVPFIATVCPFEAESYTESGDDIVEGVAMPDEIAAWVQIFIDEHHVEETFKKRKKKPYDPRKGGFSKKPRANMALPGDRKDRKDA